MTAQPEMTSASPVEPYAWVRLPLSRPFTQADLDEFPELPGLQVELVDGMLLVSPGPNLAHQRMSMRLYDQLRAACPGGLEVFFPRFDVKPGDERTFEPDLLVGATEDFRVSCCFRGWSERAVSATRRPPSRFLGCRGPRTAERGTACARSGYGSGCSGSSTR